MSVEIEFVGKNYEFSIDKYLMLKGPKGDKGEPGDKGDRGEKGEPGEMGPQGPQGLTGPMGPRGYKGDKGDRGEQGIKGDTGEQGPRGYKGDKGDRGEQGIQGPAGPQGTQGLRGLSGEKGMKGDKGDPGAEGPMGPRGYKGERGESGVYVGENEPSDPECNVWIDPEGGISEELVSREEFENGVRELNEDLTLQADKLNALIKLSEGQIYDEKSVSEESYTESIGNGCYWGAVDAIGGKSIVLNQKIVSAEVDEVRVKGKNLVHLIDGYYENGWTKVTVVNGVMTVDKAGAGVYGTCNFPSEFLPPLKAGTKISFSAKASISSFGFRVRNNAGEYTDMTTNKTFTLTHDVDFLQVYCPNTIAVCEITEIQLEIGDKTAYAPYHEPQTIPIPESLKSLPMRSAGTVHDEIDFDRKVHIQRVGVVDLGTLNWSIDSVYNGFYANFSPASAPTAWSVTAKILCAKYAASNMSARPDKAIILYNSMRVFVKDSDYTAVSDFKAAMDGVPLFYELAEPIEIDISAELVDFPEWFEVEPNGSIEYHHSLADDGILTPIPHTVTYVRKLNEV